MASARKTINDLDQWQLLLKISPVFSSDIPWRTFEAGGCDYVVARESADLFKVHFGLIPAHVSADSILYGSMEEKFLRGIKPLLYMLEQIVMDIVCDESEDHNWDLNHPIISSGLNKEYPKLVALSRVMESQTSTSLTRFLCLHQSAADLKRMRLEVQSFINDVEPILGDPIQIEKKLPAPDEKKSLVPNDKKPLSWFRHSLCTDSTRLFNSLSNHLRSCTATPDHSARLKLKHFPQEGGDAIHLELCVLFESCSAQETSSQSQKHWQETQCVVPPIGHSPDLDVIDLWVVSICQETQEAHKADKVFAIQLCDEGFLDISSSRIDQEPMSPDLTPTFALSSLLESGILQKRYRFFPSDKMVLAYTLAQALLAFHEGPWLQKIWTLDNIFFLHSPSEQKVYNIHHPYVSCVLSQERPPMDDTLRSGMKHPLIFSFAKLLVELETGEKVKLKPGKGYFSALRDLCKGWKNRQLPVHYADAFDACVFFDKYFRQDQMDDSNTTIHDTILKRIVHPLEKVVNLSEKTEWGLRSLDLGSGIRTFDRQSTLGSIYEASYATNPSPLENMLDPNYNDCKFRSASTNKLVTFPQMRVNDDRATGDAIARHIPVLFDVKKPDQGSGIVRNEWKKWLKRFRDFRGQILPLRIDPDTHQRVRVTVIDTGIDESHPYIEKHWKCRDHNSTAKYLFRDFVAPDQCPEHPPIDEDGHGTFIAGILLQVAPDIELSIARIGATRNSIGKDLEFYGKVESAIEYAIETWQTEIISLSFGTETMSSKIRKAIEKAIHKNIIVLAAAGNGGNCKDISYPAKEDGVFKIFAATAQGQRAEFSPPTSDRDYSFFILGCGVLSAWPLRRLDQARSDNLELFCESTKAHTSENGCGESCDIRVILSGASFATPIAAGLVALVYQFYNVHQGTDCEVYLREGSKDRFKTRKAVREILTKMSRKSEAPYDFQFIGPERSEKDYFYYGEYESKVEGRTPAQSFSKKLSHILIQAGV